MADPAHSPMENSLRSLGSERATGCLSIRKENGTSARVYLREGLVYAVEVPGPRPILGTRLVTLGATSSRDVFLALDRQWADLDHRTLGDVLVESGFADRAPVEQGVREYVFDGLTELLAWRSVTWEFRPDRTTRKDLFDPAEVEAVLAEAHARQQEWSEHTTALGHADVLVAPSKKYGRKADDGVQDPMARAVAGELHGEEPLSRLAERCGFSRLETVRSVRALHDAGAVTVSSPRPREVAPAKPSPKAAGKRSAAAKPKPKVAAEDKHTPPVGAPQPTADDKPTAPGDAAEPGGAAEPEAGPGTDEPASTDAGTTGTAKTPAEHPREPVLPKRTGADAKAAPQPTPAPGVPVRSSPRRGILTRNPLRPKPRGPR